MSADSIFDLIQAACLIVLVILKIQDIRDEDQSEPEDKHGDSPQGFAGSKTNI